jgi:uncharacterized protein
MCFRGPTARGARRRALLVAAAAVLSAAISGGAAAADGVAPGSMLGADLMTEDPAASRAFYEALFGWSYADRQGGFAVSEIIAGGSRIGLIVPASDDDPDTARGRWITTIGVADAEDAAATAAKDGGATLLRPLETRQGGRFTVLADPEGAQFIAFSGEMAEAAPEAGPAPGMWSWFVLFTTEPERAAAFYGDLAGLETAGSPSGDAARQVFEADGAPVAGLVRITGERVDPVWVPFVGVEALDDAIAKAESLGASLAARDARAAVILDPNGAAIGLQELGAEGGE